MILKGFFFEIPAVDVARRSRWSRGWTRGFGPLERTPGGSTPAGTWHALCPVTTIHHIVLSRRTRARAFVRSRAPQQPPPMPSRYLIHVCPDSVGVTETVRTRKYREWENAKRNNNNNKNVHETKRELRTTSRNRPWRSHRDHLSRLSYLHTYAPPLLVAFVCAPSTLVQNQKSCVYVHWYANEQIRVKMDSTG